MECLEPGAFTAERLLAYAGGEGDDQVAAHVATCRACAEQVDQYATADRLLHAQLYRIDCPASQDLGELALDLLAPQRAIEVRAHLAACLHCAGELTTLQDALRDDPLAEQIMQPGILRKLVAHLVSSLPRGLAPAGVRGMADSAMLTYMAGSVTVSLTIEAEGSGTAQRWVMLGLVLDERDGEQPVAGVARLSMGGLPAGEVELDELGNLAFTDLAAGMYDLELTLADRLIEIPDVPVGVAQH